MRPAAGTQHIKNGIATAYRFSGLTPNIFFEVNTMKARSGIVRHGMRLLIVALALATVSLAQMGGGMMGGGYGNGYGGMMGGSLGGMMGGSLSGMMGGGSGLTIGPDGTLYIMRSAATQAQGQVAQTVTSHLAAIDANGNTKWTLPINSSSASQPVLGKDGTLFVTTSDWQNWMYNWMYNRSTPAAGTTSNLLVVKPDGTSASIVLTVPLAGQVASAPQIATDNAGGYVVYVVTVDGFNGNGFNTGTTSGSYLYAFSPTGALKYRLQLSQGGYGVTGFGCW